MTTYGLLSTGFVPKTIEIIRAEVNALFYARYGNSFDMSDLTPQGWIVGIMSEREALIWEILEAIVSSRDPDAAFGVYLDTLLSLSGTLRVAAKASTVTLTATGTDATTIPALSQASNQVTLERFDTTDAAELAELTAWAISTAYVLGDRRSNGGNSYLCTTAGTSAGSGGPTTEVLAITDGTVVWRFLGNGTAAVDIPATSSNTGVILGASGDLNVIETPVSGWDSVINVLDATPGATVELDGPARLRRETVLATGGSTPLDSLRADLLGVTGVTSVKIFENKTDSVDGDGVPPHSIEALIQGGANQDIWNMLLSNGPAGYNTYGTITGTADDALSVSHDMAFSRPTETNVYVSITLEYDVALYPADGDAQVTAQVVLFGDAQSAGKNVVSSAMKAQAHAITGVLEASIANIGLSVTPTLETTLQIGTREIAVFDSSRIVITSAAGTP